MAYDPSYLERCLNKHADANGLRRVSITPEREGALHEKPDMVVGFLLGKGLTPQEVADSLSVWWWEGFRFSRLPSQRQEGVT